MKKLAIILVVCLAVTMSLFGCGSNPTPTETADTFLNAVKAGDADTLKTVYEGDNFDVLALLFDDVESDGGDAVDDEYFEKTLTPLLQDFDYKLSNEKIDGDKATVDVKITTYDIGGAFLAFMEDYFGQALELAFSGASDKEVEELANSIFEEKINKLTDKDYSETVTLDLVNKDGIWKVTKIDESSELINAISGNMIKAIEEIDEAFDE
ncbi:MAG: DUF4878 domain-containing protein [Bacillota bacterium]|nr:DUF4878 domain-containing protein [Bacillota bacterium]